MIKTGRQRLLSLSGAALAALLLLAACGGGGGDKEEARDDDPPEAEETTETTLPPGSSYFAEATVPEVAVFDAVDGTQPIHRLAHPVRPNVPLVFLVDGTEVDGERVPVYLPVKPNGSKGWVDKSSVKLVVNPYSIRVELAAHKLTVNKGTETIIDTAVGLGEAGKDTPSGTYFIKELIKNVNPTDVYGPFAYGISAFTENPSVAERFGGDGVIGVHGNNDPSSIGKNVSNGCIRLPNDVITEMADILPLGTPIEIVA